MSWFGDLLGGIPVIGPVVKTVDNWIAPSKKGNNSDSSIVPSLINGAATIGSAFIGSKATSDTNKQQLEATSDARAWEERMSNTAYQRARKDMEAAGINPILAAQQGGAGTPNVSVPQLHNPGGILSEAGSSAVQNMLQTQNLREIIRLNRTQQAVNNANAASIVKDAERKSIENKVVAAEAGDKIKKGEARSSRPSSWTNFFTDVRDAIDTINPFKR